MVKRAARTTRKTTARKKTSRKKVARASARGRARPSGPRPGDVAKLFQVYYDRMLRRGPADHRNFCCGRLAAIAADAGLIGGDFAGVLREHFPSATDGQFGALKDFAPGPLQLFRIGLAAFLRCDDGPWPPIPPDPLGDPLPFPVKFDARDHDGPDTVVLSLDAKNQGTITFLRKRPGR